MLQVQLMEYVLLKYCILVLKVKKVQPLCKIPMKNSTKLFVPPSIPRMVAL